MCIRDRPDPDRARCDGLRLGRVVTGTIWCSLNSSCLVWPRFLRGSFARWIQVHPAAQASTFFLRAAAGQVGEAELSGETLKRNESNCVLVSFLQGRRSVGVASTRTLWFRNASTLVPLQRALMNSLRRKRRAVQSSSMATERTVSKPASLSAAQPVSRLKSHLNFFEVPLG